MRGEIIAESTLLKFVWRLCQALEAWALHATELLLKAPAINVDEISLRVDKKNRNYSPLIESNATASAI